MRERLEESESIAGRKYCNQPYSLAVCSAVYSCRAGTYVNRNIGDLCINPFLAVGPPNIALPLTLYVAYLFHESVSGLIKLIQIQI